MSMIELEVQQHPAINRHYRLTNKRRITMTGTFNRATILGHLGADPEIRATANGEIARLSIATNERFKDKNGERQERTDWHRAVIFSDGLVSKVVKPYLKKGSSVLIEGAIRTDSYEKDGERRFTTEIIVSDLTLMDSRES